MKKIILLTGIHGVGKGYLSNCIKNRINIPIYEASKLIRQSGNISDVNKKVNDINNNQEILCSAINNFIKEDLFILDGHTCLLNHDGKIEKIDLNCLLKFNIIGVIYVYDDVRKIEERLYKRDGIKYNLEKLSLFQKMELENSVKLSELTNTDFLKFKSGNDINLIINFLKEV